MAATTTSSKTSKGFIGRIIKDYPKFNFVPGPQEHWSPKTNTITYSQSEPLTELRYGLLHELAHALNPDHIQDCLDTYRDWLHRRSRCPTCGMHVLQDKSNSYKCFNCGTSWQVSGRRFARPYRLRT
jgi:predicted RNA-binding Zn-ribbon protein involved in translation (DUF1610 family)